MASRQFNQFMSSLNFQPVFIEGSFQVGSTGAVLPGSFSGAGLSASSTLSVVAQGTGLYRLQLADPYYRIVGANFEILPGPSSCVVFEGTGNIVTGQPYQILGGTSANPTAVTATTASNWYTLGLHPGLNPTVGMTFVATSASSQTPGTSGVTSAGQGAVQAIGVSNIDHIEVMPGSNLTLAPTSALNGLQGSIIQFQTLRGSSTTNYNFRFAPSSCTIRYNLFLRNSSIKGYNEASTGN